MTHPWPPLPAWAVDLPIARPLIAAGVVLTDDDGLILLVKPSYKPGWDLPGGIVEPGESPRRAAARELQEELSVAIEPGRLLAVDWDHDGTVGDKILWLFDGGIVPAAVRAAVRVDGDELLDAAWYPAEEVAALCPPPLARRLARALDVRSAGGQGEGAELVYLEHGSPP